VGGLRAPRVLARAATGWNGSTGSVLPPSTWRAGSFLPCCCCCWSPS
jgi:hypothetical protein